MNITGVMNWRPRKLQVLRRATQLLALCLLLLVPAIARYRHYLAAFELDDNLKRWSGTPQGAVLAAIDSVFRALPRGEEERAGRMVRDRDEVIRYTQAFGGGAWSGTIAGASMTDPLAAAEAIAAQKRITRVLAISLIIPVLMTLILGRVFCSWVCPMGLLLEMTDKLRSLARKLELRPLNIRVPRLTKYTLLGAGLAIGLVFSTPLLGYIYPPAIFTREAHGLVFGNFARMESGNAGLGWSGLTWMSLIIAGIVLVEISLSRRWWCRYVCPGGALYAVLGAARPVRVKLVAAKCTGCGHCIPVCPMALNPMENEMGIDCDSCGKCISHCGDGALKLGLAFDLIKRATPPVAAGAGQAAGAARLNEGESL